MSIENGSTGNKDGIFMALAIAVILIFTIRIYSDYITHPNEQVKQPSGQSQHGQSEGKQEPTSGSARSLFRPSSPYPRGLDEVKVGLTLSELRDLELPNGKLDRSVYSFRPKDTPFKSAYCMLEVGEKDPQVTSIIYFYRDSKARALVRQRALEAFGEAEASTTEHGERLMWHHLDDSIVTLDADRYSIEEDLGHDQGDVNPDPNSDSREREKRFN